MTKKVKYRVVMQHCWGNTPRRLGLFENKNDAEKDAKDTEDSMYDAWVEEEEVEE